MGKGIQGSSRREMTEAAEDGGSWEGRGCAGMRRRTEAGWKCVCFRPMAGGPRRTATFWVGNSESSGMAV